MTPPTDRSGPADPGTAPLPRVPAGLVEPPAELPPPPLASYLAKQPLTVERPDAFDPYGKH